MKINTFKLLVTFIIFLGLKLWEGFNFLIIKPLHFIFVIHFHVVILWASIIVLWLLNMWFFTGYGNVEPMDASLLAFFLLVCECIFIGAGIIFSDEIKNTFHSSVLFIKTNWNKAEKIQERWLS